MKFDFDTPVNRRGSGSYKWDSPDGSSRGDFLPMWVADMDFRTAPCVIDALERRVSHGVFGYTAVGNDYYDALTSWFGRRHGWNIDRQGVIYTSGVVPAISAIIKALVPRGGGVIVMTPVYNCFFSSIRNNGCRTVESPLIDTGMGYEIDFDDLERRAAAEGAAMILLCNPHNPGGRVWTREELEKIDDISTRHGLFVVSDEIHCELTFPGQKYIPYSTLGENARSHSVSCVSPSKAFNTAGLQIANIVTHDPVVAARIDRAINDNEVCDVNPFGVVGLIAAYNDGEPWLDALKGYLYENYAYLCGFFAENLPAFRVMPMQATYLAWIDCSGSGMTGDEVARRLLDETGLMVSAGTTYGKAGTNFVRLNFACQRTVLADALERFMRVFDNKC
ncbi:MAG: pyridoxal phosphate-dependent aminotransferase [Duncaniella sp.]|nr:pyridoxal phosphate-dependent aminotransferase [Duncaniella sp.]HBI59558.1 cystathionine beta-lyase [Porphyromonadaceae bacterium]